MLKRYIDMFENSDVVVLNKPDLLPYIQFNKESFVKGIRALNPKALIFEVSCAIGEGLAELSKWLQEMVKK